MLVSRMCSSHAHREIIRSTPRRHSAATGKVAMVGTGGIVCILTFQYDHSTYLSYLTFWCLTIRTCLMDTSGIGGYSSASQRMTSLAARHNGGRQRAMVMCNPHKHVSLPTPIGLMRWAGYTNMTAACRRFAAQPTAALHLIRMTLENCMTPAPVGRRSRDSRCFPTRVRLPLLGVLA